MARRTKQEVGADTKQKIVLQCVKQYEAGIKYRKAREKDWNANEDLYLNKVRKSLKGRFNVPLPMMPGYIDTLISKTVDTPVGVIGHINDAHIRAAKKVQAFFERDTDSIHANWAGADLDGKKMNALYGRTIYLNYSESDPAYKSYRELVDVYDFFCEPLGGKYLESHNFCGQDNIFKSEYDLQDNYYDQEQVRKLIASINSDDKKQASQDQKAKQNRLAALGITGEWTDYTGDKQFKLVMMGTVYKGERYFVIFNHQTKVWVKIEKLTEVWESNLWPWTSWASFPDRFNFWSKAPADDFRPACEAINVLFNQVLDNRQKKNWPQRAFDAEIFDDPAMLEYRPDGIIPVVVPDSKNLQNGIYEFKAGDIGDTMQVVQIIDSVLGQKSGVTASAQGQTDKDVKVGVYYGDLKQVADRLGLYNRSYVEELEQGILRWSWNLWEHCPQKEMVKVIGENGAEWDILRKEDAEPDFSITIKGGTINQQADEIKKKRRVEALMAIKNDGNLNVLLNRRLTAENILRAGDWEESEIKAILDPSTDATDESISKAAQAIQEVLDGRLPRRYRGATTAFAQKIIDYISDAEITQQQYDILARYVQAHIDIIQQNMVRKAMMSAMVRPTVVPGGNVPTPGQPAGNGGAPVPGGTPQGTASQSAEISNALNQ